MDDDDTAQKYVEILAIAKRHIQNYTQSHIQWYSSVFHFWDHLLKRKNSQPFRAKCSLSHQHLILLSFRWNLRACVGFFPCRKRRVRICRMLFCYFGWHVSSSQSLSDCLPMCLLACSVYECYSKGKRDDFATHTHARTQNIISKLLSD